MRLGDPPLTVLASSFTAHPFAQPWLTGLLRCPPRHHHHGQGETSRIGAGKRNACLSRLCAIHQFCTHAWECGGVLVVVVARLGETLAQGKGRAARKRVGSAVSYEWFCSRSQLFFFRGEVNMRLRPPEYSRVSGIVPGRQTLTRMCVAVKLKVGLVRTGVSRNWAKK